MPDIRDIRKKGEAGSVVAQTVLGVSYLHGINVEADYEEAFQWLTEASAKVHLGRWLTWHMYERGLATAVDIEEAARLYERGALAGEFLGCVFLARIFASGARRVIDQSAALRWYRRAADQRNQVANCAELQEAAAYIASHSDAA